MGVALYVAVKGKQASGDWGMDGKSLGRAYESLMNVLADAGLVSLYEFLGGDPTGELPEMEKRWFAPAKMLPSVRKLVDHVASGAERADDRVLSDLRDMVRLLEAAEKVKARARIQMDI